MTFEEFRGRIESAEKLSAAGDDRAAAAALRGLAESDLPDLDRAMAWILAAEALDRAGDREGALAAYDASAALEAPHKRFQALFRKSDYLLRLGLKDESRALLAELKARPETTLSERNAFESRLKLLRRK